jgi:hypothetical protein
MTTLVAEEEVAAIYSIFIHSKEDKQYIYPHVDNIDGIDVEVQIIFVKTSLNLLSKLYYKVRANFFENYDGNNDEDGDERVTLFESKITHLPKGQILTKSHIRDILVDIEAQASKLLFNKRLGIFMTYRRELNKNHVSGDICCVCHELTKIKTLCEHDLCLGCSQKLTAERKCPICRACDIILLKKRQS